MKGKPIFDKNHKLAGRTPDTVKIPTLPITPVSPVRASSFLTKGTNTLPHLKYLLTLPNSIARYIPKVDGGKAKFIINTKAGEYLATSEIKVLLKTHFNKKTYQPFFLAVLDLPRYIPKQRASTVSPIERIYGETKLPTWILTKDLLSLLESFTVAKPLPILPAPAPAKPGRNWSIDLMKPHIEFVLNKENEVQKFGPHSCGMCGTDFAIDMETGKYFSLSQIRMAFDSNYEEDMYKPFLDKIKTLPRFICYGEPDCYDNEYGQEGEDYSSNYNETPIIEKTVSDERASGYALVKDVLTCVATMTGERKPGRVSKKER